MKKLPPESRSREALQPYIKDRECYDVAQAVARKFGLQYDTGFFIQKDGSPADHAWCRDADGTIIDTTYSQFNPRVKVGRFVPGSKIWNRYRSYNEHHPADAPDHCLLREIGRDEPCEVCDYDGKPTAASRIRKAAAQLKKG
jgi:hypothetical protein